MKVSTRISAVWWISGLALLLLPGCAMNRADSLRMLDRRAEYEDPADRSSHRLRLRESTSDGLPGPVPVRSQPKVAEVWIHAHEMASRDYFWGGWMSVVVESDQWEMKRPEVMDRVSKREAIKTVRRTSLSLPPTAEIAPEKK